MVGFPAIGDRIGPYRVDAEIGRGGMGIVYRATQLALDRPVALKILDPRFSADAEYSARFAREAAVLARLDSPHVVQIFDHGVDNERLYLAMQYVAGGDLGQLIGRTGPLAPAVALQIYRHVLTALSDAHADGIVHRDVKPSNVLLRPGAAEPFAYLCDFGIAQTPDSDLTQPGLVAGSWAFMSPERHAGQPATPQSDLYSAACVLWAMLTSRNVYSGTDVQIAMSHQNAPVPQLPGSDPLIVSLNRLFWANLAKNPAERPDTAADALVLAQAPLGLADGVAPLSITKPDSGIFRAARPASAGPASASVPAAVPGSEPPAGHGAGSADPTAALLVRRSPARWLVGGAALALTAVLVLALINWSGATGRSLPGAASTPGDAPSATPAGATSASSGALGYECWDGAVSDDLSRCSTPRGRAGLDYLYLSLQPDSCIYVEYRATTGAYECEIGTTGLIRYRFWSDASESERHYSTKYDAAIHTAMLLDGHQVGDLYRLNRRAGGVYKMSGLWLDGHLSFSVESATIAGRESLFDLVRIRAYEQLPGFPQGSAATAGQLG